MKVNSYYSSVMRFSGMASGLDTETIVKNLIQIEQLKVDRLHQQKTKTEWLRDDYRNVYKTLKEFKDGWFDVLNDSTYMLSSNAYNSYRIDNTHEKYLSVTARSDAYTGTVTIDYIESLAESASIKGKSGISGQLEGKVILDDGAELENKSLKIELDGVAASIKFERNYEYGESSALIADLQSKLDRSFGANRVKAELNAEGRLILKADGSKITVSGEVDSALSVLGLTNGQSNRVNLDAPLGEANLKYPVSFGANDTISFEINGVHFEFDSSSTLRQIMSRINSSDAGVKMSYSSLTDSFVLTASTTGSGQTIRITNLEGNLFPDQEGQEGSIGISTLQAEGRDAVLSINGVRITRSTNSFTIDGLSYTLKETYSAAQAEESPIKITAEYDPAPAVERIKSFVAHYNKVIDYINNELSEEQFRDYDPLTESQKEEMSDKEIELWEEKAKSGLLRNNRILQGIVNELRRALTDLVDEAGLTLSSIGITSGSYTDRGKLQVNESKLKEALLNNRDKVEKLFIAKSDISYSPDLSLEERTQRYRQSGLMHRVSDILNDYIRTTRNKNGNKGILLEKAGISGDTTEYKNTLSNEIKRIEERITRAVQQLNSKEEAYWKKFTVMEKAIQQMNSQSSWLTAQLGLGNG